jgi:hypothetical protein
MIKFILFNFALRDYYVYFRRKKDAGSLSENCKPQKGDTFFFI